MEELEHFLHDHPLILRLDYMEDGLEVYCYECERPIIGLSYGCTKCKFFLHKSCAELPHQMIYHSHPEHLLTLLPKPPYSCACDVCRESCDGFVYNCSLCKFDVDIRCASVVHNIQQRIHHKSHTQHHLTPFQKPAMVLFDACGTEHRDNSYLCTTCGFWVSQKCASKPSTVKLNNHYHPLTLIYSIPYQYSYSDPRLRCTVCKDPVYRRNWVYYYSDSDCTYFVHINCATSETTEHSTDCKIEIEHKDIDFDLIKHNSGITTSNIEPSKDCKAEIKVENQFTLPADESVDLITLFIENIKLVEKYKQATEITHFSHDHTLYFSNKQIDQESYSKSNMSLLNEVKNEEKCNGCARRISAPFYHCVQCNFFLHECCAELPSKLYHPCHPEHKLLLTTNFHLRECTCCHLPCNLFKYGCDDCNFYLDIKCASLPRIIRHEAHKHTLVLRRRRFCCSACGHWLEFGFICDHCNINICVRCALLPGTVRHRYDKHPFTLTYSRLPLKDQAVDDNYESYCEICEEEIDLKLWYYHCSNCDQSLDTKCICPVDKYSNMKFGVTFTIEDYHQLNSRDCNAKIKVENRIILPANESVDLVTLFINDIKLVGKYKGATEITHFSHDHTLYFSNKQIDQESYTKSNLPLLKVVKNKEKCNGCSQRISAPFYHCVQCNFFLHEFCAELPSKLHHPCHLEHPLLLTTSLYPYKCQCCLLPCNLFKYGCHDCSFYLDIKCASLPRIIRHEAHKHTLLLRPRIFDCSTCGDQSRSGFICDHCNINICIWCALLPGTVRHRYDKHPFTLTYFRLPLKDQAVDDNYKSYCKICEEEINLKFWYYHCGNCDQSLHTKCIRPPVDYYSNIKFGVTLNIEDLHQHLLTLVPSPTDRD